MIFRGTQSESTRPRGMALYIAVVGMTLIVSLLGLASLAVVRIDRSRAEHLNDLATARVNARAALEWALRDIANDTSWRTNHPLGVESAKQSLGTNSRGTVSWIVEDTDGDLFDCDTELRIQGIGRVGNAVQVSSLQVEPVWEGPAVVRSYASIISVDMNEIDDNEWYCQYFKPNLPANALCWKLTKVTILSYRNTSNRTLNVKVYEPLPTNMPSSTVLYSASVSSNSFSAAPNWHEITLSDGDDLEADSGVCVAFEASASSGPIDVIFQNAGVGVADSAMITGNPTWNNYYTDQSLMYVMTGVYTTTDGEVVPLSGTWKREPASVTAD